MTRRLRFPTLCVLLVAMAGCGSWENVRLSDVHRRVHRGDKVRYETKTGGKAETTIIEFQEPDLMVGQKRSVRISNLKKLEVYRARSGGSSQGISKAVVAALGLAVSLFLATLSGGF